MTRVSFVVANYNYAKYLPACLDSALNQDWHDVEIIVVDDGSTDDSKEVISSYCDRITAIFQENSGQRVANNTAFSASTGDIIVFLDADDTISPDFASAVATAWRPGVSKVQVQMIQMDQDGKQYGVPFPAWTTLPSPNDIRRWTITTSEYPTPPGTGNAYSRDFLGQIFPIGPENDSFTDSTCLPMAPLMGDVLTIRRPLAQYRRHGANDSNLTADPSRFAREVARAVRRSKTTTALCRKAGIDAPPEDVVRRSWYLLQLRIASMRLQPDTHPFPGDHRGRMLLDTFRNLVAPGSEPFKRRVLLTGWSVATILAPKSVAGSLIRRKFPG